MTILGLHTPAHVVLYDGKHMTLRLNADQRSQYERFCNDLMQRVSVTVWEAMIKANEYVVHGLNGVKLNDDWGQTYHDLIGLFPPEEADKLTRATQAEIDYWDPLKRLRE